MSLTEQTRYLSCADTAKLLRGALKAAFPGVKFSVRSHTYAGGASIDVDWTDGPTERKVRAVTELYRGAEFDGMTDMKSHHDTLLATPDGGVECVSFGADFIFTSRTVSPGWLAVLAAQASDSGHVSRPEQCRGCNNWMPADSRAWLAEDDHYTAFCCSATCAAKIIARWTDA